MTGPFPWISTVGSRIIDPLFGGLPSPGLAMTVASRSILPAAIEIPPSVGIAFDIGTDVRSVLDVGLNAAASHTASCTEIRDAWGTYALRLRKAFDDLLKQIEEIQSALHDAVRSCRTSTAACADPIVDFSNELFLLSAEAQDARDQANTELRDSLDFNCRSFGISTGILSIFGGAGSIVTQISRFEISQRMENLRNKLLDNLRKLADIRDRLNKIWGNELCPDPALCATHKRLCPPGWVSRIRILQGKPQIVCKAPDGVSGATTQGGGPVDSEECFYLDANGNQVFYHCEEECDTLLAALGGNYDALPDYCKAIIGGE
jgi:hypothetical protein